MNRVHVHRVDDGAATRVAVLDVRPDDEFADDHAGPGFRIRALADGVETETPHVPVEVVILDPPPAVGLDPCEAGSGSATAGRCAAELELTIVNAGEAGFGATTYEIRPSTQPGFAAVPSTSTIALAPGSAATLSIALVPDSTLVQGIHDWSLAIADPSGWQAEGFILSSLTIDLEPPTVPGGLAATVAMGAVTLTWEPSCDAISYITRYDLERDGIVIASVPATSGRIWIDEHPPPVRVCAYRVRAIDEYGHASAWSPACRLALPPVATRLRPRRP